MCTFFGKIVTQPPGVLDTLQDRIQDAVNAFKKEHPAEKVIHYQAAIIKSTSVIPRLPDEGLLIFLTTPLDETLPSTDSETENRSYLLCQKNNVARVDALVRNLNAFQEEAQAQEEKQTVVNFTFSVSSGLNGLTVSVDFYLGTVPEIAVSK